MSLCCTVPSFLPGEKWLMAVQLGTMETVCVGDCIWWRWVLYAILGHLG